ncbi:MAG: hypothetical protein RL748_3421 [Pseudomonadota bacterium]|jgi:plasmid stability protein
MTSKLVVRNVDDDIALALKLRAVRNRRSTEAEHLEILKSALHRPVRRSFLEVLMVMPDVGEDSDFERCRYHS